MSKVRTNNVSRETIYGWFPTDEDKPKRSPTDIYMNLGSRHPKQESFVEKNMLKEYVKDIKLENFNEKTNNTDQEVDPPWGLCFKPLPNKSIENNDEKALVRSKSAPIEWKPKKLPITIPKPILKNLFYKEPKHSYFSMNQKDSSEKERKIAAKLDGENMDEISNEIDPPCFFESLNIGKKPIISQKENEKYASKDKKIRPKTAGVFIKSTQEQTLVNKRPKSTIPIRPKLTHVQLVSDEKFKSKEALNSAIETESSTFANQNEFLNEKSKTKTLLENWKSNLLEREKFLHPRPNYFVRIDMNKLQPDCPAPELHYNASETYFYNTMPFRKATFSIHPSFISENLNIQKIDLKRKDSGGPNKAVRYRRDFAFVY